MTKTGSDGKTAIIRPVLFILAAFLIFGGPTYFIYFTQKVDLPYSFSVLGGLIVFVIGILFFWRLIQKQT